ncbi:MAG: DMT family transporter [Planctomycetota bacterium]|nr:DMT family transporter [Planctomycetota bacterium]
MEERRRLFGLGALVLVTILWAWGFLWTKEALDVAGETFASSGPESWSVVSLFLLIRFGISMLVLPLFVRRCARGLTLEHWRVGAFLAVLLGVGFFTQTQGLQGINPAVSAFLTSLYVVFTALLGALFLGHKHRNTLLVGVLFATFGAGFISGPPRLNFDLPEWLTVACAFFYAIHILAIDRFTRSLDALQLTFTCLCWLSLASLLAVLAGIGMGVESSKLQSLALDPAFFLPSLWCALFVTALALAVMNAWQKEVSPVRAAIVYSLEPVWTVLLMLILGWSGLDAWAVVGGGALLVGNLVAEIKK